jgi:hypothetical protein
MGIRKYALHPTRGHDIDRKAWLTEQVPVLATAGEAILRKDDRLMTRRDRNPTEPDEVVPPP